MTALKIGVAVLFVSAFVVPHAQAPSLAQPPRRAIQRQNAPYPVELAGSRVDAVVTLKVTVSAAGDVLSVDNPRWQITVYSDSPIQSYPAFWAGDPGRLFVEAAETAARRWKFEPEASDSTTTISFSFSMPRPAPPASPSAAGQGPLRVGGEIKAPRKILDVKPVYPDDALAARVQGVVVIEATIARDGTVADAKVLRSVPTLDQAALDAVLQWRFTPTLVNGEPVPVIMTVTVNFSLQ